MTHKYLSREPSEAMCVAGMEAAPMKKEHYPSGAYTGRRSSAVGTHEVADIYRAMHDAASSAAPAALTPEPHPGRTHFADDDTLAYIKKLEEGLRAAERDGERLDWLEREWQAEQDELMVLGHVETRSLFRRNQPITRAAIDAELAALSSRAQTKDKP